ncbi:hypothetical protein LRP52_49765, partial [Photobacterium sp. ZSDE20]|nr:hypothetical protein [Photobacterium sp. ZSDE20]
MGVYTILQKDDVYIAIDLLGKTTFEEINGYKDEGFYICAENQEGESSQEVIKNYKIALGYYDEFADTIYISTCSALPVGVTYEKCLGVVCATGKTGVGIFKFIGENLFKQRYGTNI